MKKSARRLSLIKRMLIIRIVQFFEVYKETWVHYIGGSEALPPPLENEEENFLLSRLKGDEEVVKAVLIERNLRLVVYIAKSLKIPESELRIWYQ